MNTKILTKLIRKCPHCGQNISTGAKSAGATVHCPTCSGKFALRDSAPHSCHQSRSAQAFASHVRNSKVSFKPDRSTVIGLTLVGGLLAAVLCGVWIMQQDVALEELEQQMEQSKRSAVENLIMKIKIEDHERRTSEIRQRAEDSRKKEAAMENGGTLRRPHWSYAAPSARIADVLPVPEH